MPFCRNCGTEVYPEDTFCTVCGVQLNHESSSEPPDQKTPGSDKGSDTQATDRTTDMSATDTADGSSATEPGYAELAGKSKGPDAINHLSQSVAFLRHNPTAFAVFGVAGALQLVGPWAGWGLFGISMVLTVVVLAVGSGVVIYGIPWVNGGNQFDLEALLRRSFRRLVHAVVAGIIWVAIVSLGIVLLILPGIYLMGRFGFVGHNIFLESAGPIEAFRSSWAQSSGHLITILAVMVAIYIPSILVGVIPIVGQPIAVTVLYPIMFVALTYLYLDVQADELVTET